MIQKGLESILKNNATPSNISYNWNWGSILGLALGIQVITGIFLAMNYTASIEWAFESVEHIMRDVKGGWLLRYIRANGASLFFIIIYLRIGKGMYYGSYRKRKLWGIGIIIYLVLMAIAFIGYVLPWSQMSYWGGTVITNFVSAVPYIGEELVEWIWGGYSVSEPTLKRFYSLHYCLPFVLIFLVILRLIALKEAGSSNELGDQGNVDYIFFAPYYIIKDLFGYLITLIAFILVIGYLPTILLDHDRFVEANPLVTPIKIQPEFYYLPFYAILRSIPDKLLGVIAMILSITVLGILPYVETCKIRGNRFRPLMKLIFWLFIANIFMLGYVGAQHPVYPYEKIGLYCTIFRFVYFIIIVPIVGIIENVFLIRKRDW